MSAANDLRVVEFLAGASFGPDAKLILPSGMTLDSDVANTVVNPDGLERRERTPIFDEVFEEHALDTAPEWPEPETEVLPVDRPTVEFAAVKPGGVFARLLRRLAAVRWSGTRVTAAVSSGVTLAGSGALWLVIR